MNHQPLSTITTINHDQSNIFFTLLWPSLTTIIHYESPLLITILWSFSARKAILTTNDPPFASRKLTHGLRSFSQVPRVMRAAGTEPLATVDHRNAATLSSLVVSESFMIPFEVRILRGICDDLFMKITNKKSKGIRFSNHQHWSTAASHWNIAPSNMVRCRQAGHGHRQTHQRNGALNVEPSEMVGAT